MSKGNINFGKSKHWFYYFTESRINRYRNSTRDSHFLASFTAAAVQEID